jgi:hypothetical protein
VARIAIRHFTPPDISGVKGANSIDKSIIFDWRMASGGVFGCHTPFLALAPGGYERVRPDKRKTIMFFNLTNVTKVFMTKVTTPVSDSICPLFFATGKTALVVLAQARRHSNHEHG